MSSLRIRTKLTGQSVSSIYYQGEMLPWVFRGGKIVFAEKPMDLPQLSIRMSSDIEANWMEIGFLSAVELEGSPSGVWADIGNYVALAMENSIDLVNWEQGNFIPAPTGAVVNNGDGTFWYWARSILPKSWKNLLIDNRIESNRYGKSITALKLADVTISLPGYPYALPSQAATLQADLRAAGYAGATVTSSTAPISASIINYIYADSIFQRNQLIPVINGSAEITDVTDNGVSITLPSYPYAMPSAQATLQTDLIAAGYSGAVVKLFGDPWTIIIPDRTTTTAKSRLSSVTISPADPFPWWSYQGAYQGLDQDATVNGTYENLRSLGGADKVEADKQFARLKLIPGTRYD